MPGVAHPAARRFQSGRVRAAHLLHLSVAAFLLAACLGSRVAAEQGSADGALGWLAAGGAIYVVTCLAAARRSWWRPVALAAVLAGSALAIYIASTYAQLGYADKVTLVTQVGRTAGRWLPGLAFRAPFPNSVATGLEGLLPLAAGLALGHGASRRARLVSAAAALLIALALLLTASRGAWLAEGFVLGVWIAAWRARSAPRWRLAVPAGAAAAVAAASLVILGVAASAHPALASPWLAALDRPDRLVLYGHSLSLARDFAFTGIGLGDQFATALSRHALLIEVPFLTYSHNLLLDIWLEMGLVGLAAWTSVVAAVVVGAVAGEQTPLGNGFRGAYLGVMAMLVHGLTDARQSVDGWTWLPFFVLVALVAARLSRVDRRLAAGSVVGWIAVPTLVCLAVVAWVWPARAAWHANVGGLAELQARAADAGAARQPDAVPPETEYRQALTWDPRQPTAHRRLGIRALAADRFTEARQHLEIAAGADPENWTTRKALGLSCVWLGDLDRAEALLGALDTPEIVTELATWSWWRGSRGELTLALRAAEVAAQLRPDAEALARVRHLREQVVRDQIVRGVHDRE